MAVSDIISVIPPPPGHGWRAVDWASVEQSLGLPLPQDYKDFIAVYGPGTFDDFLHIFLPAGTGPMIQNINGRDYRLYQVESIHEDDTFVECSDMESNELKCAVRITRHGESYLLPTASEIDVAVLLEVIEYIKGLEADA